MNQQVPDRIASKVSEHFTDMQIEKKKGKSACIFILPCSKYDRVRERKRERGQTDSSISCDSSNESTVVVVYGLRPTGRVR